MKKKIGMIALLFLLIFQSVAIGEMEGYKDESVYGILERDGSSSSIYVVNAINGSTVDYGKYATLENLTNLDVIDQEEDMLTLPAYDETFYYKGTMDEYELPWDFTISYYLGGEEIGADELAGAQGELSIHISVNQGAEAKAHFFENYAVQISLALSNDLCSDVTAEGATVVEAGGTKQIAFTVMPDSTADFEITATVKDFEMDAITINAVNLVFNLDVDTSVFSDQLGDLTKAVSDLDSGAYELLKGINELSAGMESYTQGLNEYQAGMAAFAQGGGELAAGMDSISSGLAALASQNQSLSSGIYALEAATFAQINAQLVGTGLPEVNRENYQDVLAGQDALLAQVEQTLQLVDGLYGYLGGVAELSGGAASISEGLQTYMENANVLAQSANELYNGAVSLNNGLKSYRDGVAEYKSGTAQFKASTEDMDSQMETLIVDMLDDFKGEGNVISFVSEKNTNVSSVQFFFRTEPVAIDEIPDVEDGETEEDSFWDRILELFGFKGNIKEDQ